MRAMEMDINTDWVSAYTYVNDPATDPNAPVIGLKLGDDMSRDGDRYLQRQRRATSSPSSPTPRPRRRPPSRPRPPPSRTRPPRRRKILEVASGERSGAE